MSEMKRNFPLILLFSVFIAYIGWWVYLNFLSEPGTPYHDYFTDSYGIIAGLGGLVGIWAAKKWGSLRSVFGLG